jgi:long-chain acyl-CoA synthetase
MTITSLATMVLDRAERHPSRRVFQRKRREQWEDLSWQQLADQIVSAAHGLTALGFKAGDRLALLAENQPEWPIMDLACLYLGGVDVPLYLSSPGQDVAYILKDSGASFIAVSGRGQLDKIRRIAPDLPDLSHIVALDPEDQPLDSGSLTGCRFAELLALGEQQSDRRQPVADPGLATIIYTSGTTGFPKGVMLSHRNMLSNVHDAPRVLPLTADDISLSFLPLSHGFERTTGLYTPLSVGGSIAYGGGTVSLLRDLAEVRPTLLCCVPRVLELVYRRVLGERESAGFAKRQLLDWALALGKSVGTRRVEERAIPPLHQLQLQLIDRLVFQKLRHTLGGRIRFLVSGGAPLNAEIARFFYGIGITVYEGYGLTEAGPVISCNRPGQTRLGTVGVALPQVEVKIDTDGEICARGPNIMDGYYQRPEDTAAVLDADGWLHTGDVGTIDSDGFITITDRKKDLIITDSGENIAPQPIEGALKQDPLIEEACLIGDKRPFVTALLVPNQALVETLARKNGVSGDWQTVLGHQTVQGLFRDRVNAVNKTLPTPARIRQFRVLDQPFSQDRGELTPTLKVRRRHVLETRQEQIEAMYPAPGPSSAVSC